MGRKTWESLPGLLPGRPHLVLSRNPEFRVEGAETFTDLHTMVGRGFELAGELGVRDVMVIGGAQIYRALLPYTDVIYETVVYVEVEGDAHFPELEPGRWLALDERLCPPQERDDHAFMTRTLYRA